MFNITTKGQYGLLAVFKLALDYNVGPLQIKRISESMAIPRNYLEQLLLSLKKAGIVTSYRGAQGGYALARKPSEITLLEILECLEGNIVLVPAHQENQTLDFFWGQLQAEIKGKLNLSLEQLILLKQKYENQLNYTI